MTSPALWTWVWVSSASWWWTGKPGILSGWGCKESDTTDWLKWAEWWTWPVRKDKSKIYFTKISEDKYCSVNFIVLIEVTIIVNHKWVFTQGKLVFIITWQLLPKFNHLPYSQAYFGVISVSLSLAPNLHLGTLKPSFCEPWASGAGGGRGWQCQPIRSTVPARETMSYWWGCGQENGF